MPCGHSQWLLSCLGHYYPWTRFGNKIMVLATGLDLRSSITWTAHTTSAHFARDVPPKITRDAAAGMAT